MGSPCPLAHSPAPLHALPRHTLLVPLSLQNGVRNSLLVAPMPTASTSQILGNNECFEPYTSNIYVRRVLSGEQQINRSAPASRDVMRASLMQEPAGGEGGTLLSPAGTAPAGALWHRLELPLQPITSCNRALPRGLPPVLC